MINWKYCTRCRLHKTRRVVVEGRGELPAKLLFIGTGPGKSEDLQGIPFIGEAGRVLDQGLRQARKFLNYSPEDMPSFYITNVVACRPTNKRFGENRDPKTDEMNACYPRLIEIYELAQPEVVILFGKVAQKHCKKAFPDSVIFEMLHPAYLTRRGEHKAPEFTSWSRKLSSAIRTANYES